VKLHKVAFVLLTLSLSSQFGLHFWPPWAFIWGIRIDYLSPTLWFTDILITILLVSWFAQDKPNLIINNRHFFLGAALIGLIAANLLLSSSPIISLFNWLRFGELSLLGFYIYKNSQVIVKYLFPPLYISYLLSAIIGIIQTLQGHTIGGIFYFLGERSFSLSTPGIALFSFQGGQHLRSYATFPHPNAFAAYLCLSAFLMVFSMASWKRIHAKKLLVVSLPLLLMALAFSYSQGAWIALILSVGIYFLISKHNLKNLTLGVFFLLTISSLLLPLAASFVLKYKPVLGESIKGRLILATVAGKIFSTSPLFGVGFGNFIPKAAADISSLVFRFQPVHSVYLMLLTEWGIALFLFFFLAMARTIKLSKSPILLVGLVFVLITAEIDHYWITLPQTQLIFVYAIGFLLGRGGELGDDTITPMSVLTIHTDGGSRGNPGPAASAFVAFNERGEKIGEGSEYIGETTNNIAEYKAVLLALEWIKGQDINFQKIVFKLDSQLVVRQLMGEYKIKNASLAEIAKQINKLMSVLPSTTFLSIPREANSVADYLVNKCLDATLHG
jgi:ribonuclease HI/O-antigen ligase